MRRTAFAMVALLAPSLAAAQSSLRFELTLTPAAESRMRQLGLETPVDGRAYVILSRDTAGQPRLQVDVAGVPFFGMDVADWRAGQPLVLAAGGDVVAYPLRSMAEFVRSLGR